jgi:phage gp37-like protein
MADYTIEQIEDAIITAVDALKTSLGVRTVKSYQGELEEDDVKRLVALFPAVYVVYGGSAYTEHGSRKVEKMTYHLFACDKNLRSEEEARRGGAGNPGTYAMLDGVRDLLYAKQLSLEIFPFKLIRQSAVWFGGGISIYAAEYETGQSLLYSAT